MLSFRKKRAKFRYRVYEIERQNVPCNSVRVTRGSRNRPVYTFSVRIISNEYLYGRRVALQNVFLSRTSTVPTCVIVPSAKHIATVLKDNAYSSIEAFSQTENSDRLESLLRKVSHKASFPLRRRARQASSGSPYDRGGHNYAISQSVIYETRIYSITRPYAHDRLRLTSRLDLPEQHQTNSRSRKATSCRLETQSGQTGVHEFGSDFISEVDS